MLAPRRASVEQLARLPVARHAKSGRTSLERLIVEVDAVIATVRNERDGDIHVVLRGKSGAELIAEFPSSECTIGSPYAAEMEEARNRLLQIIYGSPFNSRRRRLLTKVRVHGVIFFDRSHGQNGAAWSGVELHPVLAVEAIR